MARQDRARGARADRVARRFAGLPKIEDRLLRGGLPPALRQERPSPDFYREWLDSYFARDVAELFRVEKRAAFLLLLETLLRQSGGLAEWTSLARACGLSRPTITHYVDVTQVTHVVHVLRPFHAGGRRELLAQPKIYGFNTGFVAHTRGWDMLRPEECGGLWEHLVLDTLLSIPDLPTVRFWRDASQREVDFVLPRGRGRCDAIECKWNAVAFEGRGLLAFREHHPEGLNYVVSPYVAEPYTIHVRGLRVEVLDAGALRARLATPH